MVLIIFLVVVGSLLGAFRADPLEGALIGLLLGLFLRLRQQFSSYRRETDARLKHFEAKFDALKVSPPPVPSGEVVAAASQLQDLQAQPDEGGASAPPDAPPEVTVDNESPTGFQEIPPRTPPVRRARPFEVWLERLTAGTALVWVGVLVLLIGLGFLVQLAVREGFLPIELRLASAALLGLVLIVLGWRLRERRRSYALSLQGGGLGVMYLTIFAALQLYQLIAAPLAFGLLVFLVVVSAILAVTQNALVLAVLGSVGGFLAPFLSAGEGGEHTVLFGYYLVLNVGILLIAYFKAWRPLNLVGFFFTFAAGTLWGGASYRPELFVNTELFLLAFFLLYLAVALLYAQRQPLELRGLLDGTLVFGLPVVVFGLQSALVKPFANGLALSSLGLAFIYLGLAWLLYLSRAAVRTTFAELIEAFAALGLVFASMTLPLALEPSLYSLGWALEGVGLLWLGVRQRRLSLRLFGLILQVGAVVALFGLLELQVFSVDFAGLSLTGRNMGALLIALALLYSAHTLYRYRDQLRPWERSLEGFLIAFGLLVWTFAGSAEILDRFRLATATGFQGLLFFFAFTAFACARSSLYLNWSALYTPALALLPLMVLMAFVEVSFNLFSPFGIGFWLAAVPTWSLAFGTLAWILKRSPNPESRPLELAHFIALWLLAFVSASLAQGFVSALFSERSPAQGLWGALAGGAAATLVLWFWTLPRMRRPWRDGSPQTLLVSGLAPIAGVLGVWALGVNISSSGDTAPLYYLPLLSPFDLLQAFVLLTLVRYRLALRYEVGESDLGRSLTWMLIVLGVVWPSTMIVRIAHHFYGVPFIWGALFASNLLQTSLTIFWTLFALVAMVLARHHQRRTPWLVGAGLLGLVVVKLFFVDLANVTALARVISFVGTGLLLLLIGYLAPLPPASARDNEGT